MKIIRNIFKKPLDNDELNKILDAQERDILELEDMNVNLMRKNKDLEKQIQFYQERLKIVEGIKVEEKSNVKLWKWLAGIGAGVGALLGSWLTKDDKD